MSSSTDRSNFFIVSMIFSLLGGLMILFGDFGGWLEYDSYYGDLDYYLYIGSEIAPRWQQGALVLIAGALLATTFLSYQGMRNQISPSMMDLAFALGLSALITTIILTVGFLIYVSDTEDWWPDIGFYGALVGSGVTTYFLAQARKLS